MAQRCLFDFMPSLRLLFVFVGFAPLSLLHAGNGSGYDSGGDPIQLVTRLGLDGEAGAAARIGEWLRIRGFDRAPVDPCRPLEAGGIDGEIAGRIEAMRAALLTLQGAGYRTVCFLRWEREWPSGRRPGEGPGNRSPLDLREAYGRGYAFAATYGDLVDAWEIENEPDAGFFADNADVFAAFYKAVALGLAAGREQRAWRSAEALGGPDGETADADRVRTGMPGVRSIRQKSLIVMPPLVLPPGPYLEQLRANGFLSYTEGANLHYYGFADDYSRAHARLREALTCREGESAGASRETRTVRRLPVFVTEWGYPRMDGYASQTVEGRVRQWRFYKKVASQNERLRVHAPMAFYLPPYFEYGAKEFGLTMPTAERRAGHFGFVVEDGPGSRDDGEPQAGAPGYPAGGLRFTPADFGSEKPEEWMTQIGMAIGGNEASPALAWLMDRDGRTPGPEFIRTGPRARGETRAVRARGDWPVDVEAASPVVMDLVAGRDLLAVKAFSGYVAGGAGLADENGRGEAKLVIYNFGPAPAALRLAWPDGIRPAAHGEGRGEIAELRISLEPGERREIDVELSVSDQAMTAHELALRAEVTSGGTRTFSRWATRLFPRPEGLRMAKQRALVFPAVAATRNREWLLDEQAAEEAKVGAQGRWVVTPGVVVEETPTKWRFHVSSLPPEPMRPARAELPLPDDWAPWEPGLVISFAYRVVPERGAESLRPDDPDPLRRLRTGKMGDTLEFFLRTRAGNVYCIQSPLRPTAEWLPYNQPAETLTPGFPGRHRAPLRISRERPASLVYFFRPAKLPTVYEIDRPTVAHWRKPE